MPANARSHAVLTTESKVTIRGQTTIPAPVRLEGRGECESGDSSGFLRNSAWWASLYVPTGR